MSGLANEAHFSLAALSITTELPAVKFSLWATFVWTADSVSSSAETCGSDPHKKRAMPATAKRVGRLRPIVLLVRLRRELHIAHTRALDHLDFYVFRQPNRRRRSGRVNAQQVDHLLRSKCLSERKRLVLCRHA